jgi:uncharacterized protein (TIGR03435 family)
MTGNPRYSGADMKKRIVYIMTQRPGYKLSLSRKLLLASAGLAMVGGPLLLGLVVTMQVGAQSSALDWAEAAGGRMTFDSASITQSKARVPWPWGTGPMGPLDNDGRGFGQIGYLVSDYIEFAYKLWLTPSQRQSLRVRLPKWAAAERFDIQARRAGHVTKDQKRLMMQSLLVDRFKLAVHLETQQVPAFALVLLNSGKSGPQLQPHPENASCPAPPVPSDQLADGFPAICGGIFGLQARTDGHVRIGARNVAMAQIANALTQENSGLNRPILDRTGLTGEYDFAIEFTPQTEPTVDKSGYLTETGSNRTNDYIRRYGGPPFVEALRDQLGLELEPTMGPVDVLVIDHIEEPSPN